MRIALAYLTVVLLWSTTPLAIKWSGEGPGFLFGATARMVIGAICMLFVLLISRRPLAWHRKARLTYLAVGLQIYGAMTAVYWGAQFIPSGWISVVFGLTPLITAVFAAIMLNDQALSFGKLTSYLLGMAGLAVMFGSAIQLSRNAALGIAAIFLASSIQALCSVLIKWISARVSAVDQVAGGLLVAVPAYLLTWWLSGGHWPQYLTIKSLASIIYLGTIATTIGFMLYFYLLTHLAATRVALITLIAPVLALLIGKTINHEPITSKIVMGSAMILSALFLHEYVDRILDFRARISRRRAVTGARK